MSSSPPDSISVYKNKPFARFARKARISDAALWKAASLANHGIFDADLGGGVIKQRIARPGEGKSGGSRTIILFRKGDRAVYVFGFEKKDMANISASDLLSFREFAEVYLGYSAVEMEELVKKGTILQVEAGEDEQDD